MSEPLTLTKVDSAVQGMASSPPKETKHRRASSSANGVMNINDLGMSFRCRVFRNSPLTRNRGSRNGASDCQGDAEAGMVSDPHVVTPQSHHCRLTRFRSRKINTSPTTVEDKEHLKKMLTTPPVKKIDLHFPLGLEVTARNLKGVTIKDALDAIHKQFKKRVSFAVPMPTGAVLTFCRPTMSSRSHTLPASSGTKRSRGLAWWCTSKKMPARRASPAARRRRARRRTSNEQLAPPCAMIARRCP